MGINWSQEVFDMPETISLQAIGQKVKRIVRLPITQRFAAISQAFLSARTTLMEVDGVGVYVHHDRDQTPTDDDVRRHLIGTTATYVDIEAETAEEAKDIFLKIYPGATVGTKAKALWITEDKAHKIHVFPSCKKMYRGNGDRVVCGPLSADGINGKYGGCVIEAFSPPGFPCPVEDYWELQSKK